LARQAVERGTVHRQQTVANNHRILARQAMVKQWQYSWWTADTGRFDAQAEERRFCDNNIKRCLRIAQFELI
jgi:hypothetical protein